MVVDVASNQSAAYVRIVCWFDTFQAWFPYNRSRRYYRYCRRKTCFSDGSDIWKHTVQR